MRNLSLRWKLTVVIGLCLGAGAALVALLLVRLGQVDAAYAGVLAHEVRETDRARVVQVTFKKQVQEWKNILLRGAEPNQRRTYKEKFFATEAEVATEAERLARELTDASVKPVVTDFLAAHRAMGEHYRRALEAFEASAGRDIAAADLQVKGQDRGPTDLIDGIVAQLGARIDRIATEQSARVAAQRARAVAIAGGALFFVLLVAGRIAHDITTAQRAIIRALEGITAGEMDHRLDEARRDELGHIARALNLAVDAVRARQEQTSAAAMAREQEQNESLRDGFRRLHALVSAASGGDLTARVELDNTPKVVQEIGAQLADFLAVLRDRIGSIDGHAVQLAAASEELSATARELTAASQETSDGVRTTRAPAVDRGRARDAGGPPRRPRRRSHPRRGLRHRLRHPRSRAAVSLRSLPPGRHPPPHSRRGV